MTTFDYKVLLPVLVFNIIRVPSENPAFDIKRIGALTRTTRYFMEITQSLLEIPNAALDPPQITFKGFIRNPSKKNIIDYREGIKSGDPYLNITQLITKYGYPVETHYVKTADGYILKIFRIPSKNKESTVALLQHGLQASSDDWISIGPNKSLAYLLANEGYDVWLGNNRGNKHSLEHDSLSPKNDEFWDFSWDEIGRIDIPAIIDYILENTGREKIQYVGHSQGTTVFYVMCSERPEYNDKIAFMVALAPIAFMKHNRSPIFRIVAPTGQDKDSITSQILGPAFLTNNTLPGILSPILCDGSYIQNLICYDVSSLSLGYDNSQVDFKALPTITSHAPGGSSTKQLIHYAQGIREGKFRRYNYRNLNKKIYGAETPPDYPLEKITVRMAFYYGDADWAMTVEDMNTLVEHLINANVTVKRVPYKYFSHMDFLFAKDIVKLVYNDVIDLFRKYKS